MLLPVIDEDGAPFWEYARQGELRIQACADCGRLRFPPRPCCPHCRSFASRWERMSGRGRIWSYVFAHPPLLPDYAAQAPYNVIVVELAEEATPEGGRIRLVGNLVTRADARLDSVDPARLRIGAAVKVAFPAATDDGDGTGSTDSTDGGDGADGVVVPRWLLERP